MNEEIMFQMGMNTDPFSFAIRKAKGMLGDMKPALDATKMAIGGLFAGLSIAAVSSAARGVMQFAKQITEMSENIGVSTTFLQQFGYAARKTGVDAEQAQGSLDKLSKKIGEARTGNKEAIESFDKWGVSLKDAGGNALDVEQVTEAIAKRMNEIEDPTKRAAMAFDLFGKQGGKLVATLRDLDVLKEKSKGKILDEGDIARLDSAEKKLAGIGGTLKVLGGKLLGAGLTVFGLADPNALLKKKLSEIDQNAGAKDETPKEVKKSKELINALRELDQVKREEGKQNEDGKLLALLEQEGDLAEDLKDKSLTEVERVKLQVEWQKKHNEVLKQRSEMQDKEDKKKEDADKKKKEDADRLAKKQEEYNNAKREENKADDKLANAKGDRSRLSLEDLTSSHFRFGGQLGQDQRTAWQIKRLEAQGEWNRQHGFLDDSKSRFDSADALRKQLSSNVDEKDRNPFKDLEESSRDTAEHLKILVDKAGAEGIPVSIPNG